MLFYSTLLVVDIDDCAAKPCQNGGVCKDQINGYKCTCKPGFVGVNCDKGTCIYNMIVLRALFNKGFVVTLRDHVLYFYTLYWS